MSTVAVASALKTRRSHAKLVGFAVFFVLTVFVTYMKNAKVFDPSSDTAKHFAPVLPFVVPHAIFAGVALIMGAFQFSNRLRARYLKVHRVMGYIYVGCVVIGAPLAIPLAMKIATPSLIAASVVQTFGWVFCTVVALYCIRTRNIQQHRRWMIRGYPFDMVFTVTRLIIPIPPVLRSGFVGLEIVVWCTIAAAAILPTFFLELGTIVPRSSARVST
jgi:uncharacterized membrane protein